jgi:uncharacterized protein
MHDTEVEVLITAGCSPAIIAHCEAVSILALSIAGRVRIPVDCELARRGGLFHDIGRSRIQGIGHAVAGAELAKKLGFPDALIHIILRHIGAGITAGEAERLGLPKKDYLPLTPEEKIVSYADNLHSGVRVMSFSEALGRFRSILGPGHEGIELFEKQHREIQGWMK